MPEDFEEQNAPDGKTAPSPSETELTERDSNAAQPETASVYNSSSEPYGGPAPQPPSSATPQQLAKRTPPPPADDDEEDEEEKCMLRMSFMEHLEELRTRLIRALMGLVIAFFLCIG